MAKVLLPPFSLFARGDHPPHRKRVLARRACPNEYGAEIEYEVASNWPRKKFWLYARREGFKAAGTLSTSVPAKAERWERAVKACDVAVGKDGDKFGRLPRKRRGRKAK